jgi:uncharacterized membrane protein
MQSLQYVTRVSLMTLFLASITQAAVRYTVQDLGEVTNIKNINDAGVAVASSASGIQHALRLQAGSPPLDLGDLMPGGGSIAGGIGPSGTIVGDAGPNQQAFRWTLSQGMQGLETSAGGTSAATGVNITDTIVGYAQAVDALTQPLGRRPVVWIGGHLSDLGTLSGEEALAFAINDHGDIVGDSLPTGGGGSYATLWPIEGGVIDLQTLDARSSSANALTTDRRVVGDVCLPSAGCQGFLWTPQTGMQTLALLPGDASASALWINEAGQIVGRGEQVSAFPGEHVPHALLWEAGVPTDLNTLIDTPGWVLYFASGVNAQGQIVGGGALNQVFHAFLLTPLAPDVPPPPVAFVDEVTGDFNGDGLADEAGRACDGTIWLGLAGTAWRPLPNTFLALGACDLTGDGITDLVSLSSDKRLWTLSPDLATWQPVPKKLEKVVEKALHGKGKDNCKPLHDKHAKR